MSGLWMLVAQAVKAFEFFTGETAEADAIQSIYAELSLATSNAILVGMPGCGKSTVGRELAKLLGREFYDADDEFSAMHQITPAEAILTLGEDKFRQMEHEVLLALGAKSGAVIACGGGAVTREINYRPLHQNGVILYLRRDLTKLATGGRPLSQKTSPEALYLARKAAYERFADRTVESTEIVEETARAMRDALLDFYKGKES